MPRFLSYLNLAETVFQSNLFLVEPSRRASEACPSNHPPPSPNNPRSWRLNHDSAGRSPAPGLHYYDESIRQALSCPLFSSVASPGLALSRRSSESLSAHFVLAKHRIIFGTSATKLFRLSGIKHSRVYIARSSSGARVGRSAVAEPSGASSPTFSGASGWLVLGESVYFLALV